MSEAPVQGYIVCESEKRYLFLHTFLKKNGKSKKIIVFFNSCRSIKFFEQLLNHFGISVLSIDEEKQPTRRFFALNKFSTADNGVLLCTDITAKDLQLPKVDWIVQYDPPNDVQEYIQKVNQRRCENAILILRTEELGLLYHLKQAKISVYELQFPWSKIVDIQMQLEKLTSESYSFHMLAKEAFRAYFKTYDSNPLKEIFNVATLDPCKIAKSYGFRTPPAADLKIGKSQGSEEIEVIKKERGVTKQKKIYLQKTVPKKIKNKGGVMKKKTNHVRKTVSKKIKKRK